MDHAEPVSFVKTVLPERSGLFIVSLKPNDLRILCRPGVYTFYRGDEALYVGSSRRLISRISNPNHEAATRSLDECTNITIQICKTELEARELEQEFICLLKPRYNKAVRKSRSVSMSWAGAR
jgi:excinuclease UvrABC nuclease subunit